MRKLTCISACLSLAAATTAAHAGHDWAYHWTRATSAPVVVEVGDNVGPTWTRAMRQAAAAWNRSDVVDLRLVAGRAYAPGQRGGCYHPGTVEVCGAPLRHHWIAVTRAYADSDHFDAVGVEINTRRGGWSDLQARNILCHELGHALGLRHRQADTTCMGGDVNGVDNPDHHDYAMLRRIYDHVHRPSRNRGTQDPLPLPVEVVTRILPPGGGSPMLERAMARPAEFPERFELRLPPGWREKLIRLAERNHRPVSAEAREAIRRHIVDQAPSTDTPIW